MSLSAPGHMAAVVLAWFGRPMSMKECLGQMCRWFLSMAKPPGLRGSAGMCSSIYACEMYDWEKFILIRHA